MFFYFLSNFQQLCLFRCGCRIIVTPRVLSCSLTQQRCCRSWHHATCHHTQTSPVWTAQVELCPKSYASCNGFMLLFWKFSRYTQLAFPLPLPCFHSADSPESLSAHGLIVMAQRRAPQHGGGRQLVIISCEELGKWNIWSMFSSWFIIKAKIK